MNMTSQDLILMLLYLPGFLFSLSFHEAAHAWAANLLEDSTAKSLGRMTLNPIPHIHPIGTILLPVLGMLTGFPMIGWANPVPFDPRNLKNVRRDSMYIALAGPVSNLVLMGVFAAFIYAYDSVVPSLQTIGFSENMIVILYYALQMIFVLNVVLCLFNFLPMDPLDGGKIIRGILPHRQAVKFDYFMRKNQSLITVGFLLLFFTGMFGRVFFPAIKFFANLFLGDRFLLF